MNDTSGRSTSYGAKCRSKGVVSIISRTVWDSLPPKKAESLVGPRLVVWFSDTATPECKNYSDCISAVQELQIQHMDVLRLPDIKHNFLIGGDGRVYEGRGFGVKPSNDPVILKAYPGVEETLDIAYITTLEKGDKPSRKMIRATKDFLRYSKYNGHVTLVIHHEVWEWQHNPKDVLKFMRPEYKPSSKFEEHLMTNTIDQPTPLMQETARVLVDYAVKRGLVSKDHKLINYWEKKLKPTANLRNENIFI